MSQPRPPFQMGRGLGDVKISVDTQSVSKHTTGDIKKQPKQHIPRRISEARVRAQEEGWERGEKNRNSGAKDPDLAGYTTICYEWRGNLRIKTRSTPTKKLENCLKSNIMRSSLNRTGYLTLFSLVSLLRLDRSENGK